MNLQFESSRPADVRFLFNRCTVVQGGYSLFQKYTHIQKGILIIYINRYKTKCFHSLFIFNFFPVAELFGSVVKSVNVGYPFNQWWLNPPGKEYIRSVVAVWVPCTSQAVEGVKRPTTLEVVMCPRHKVVQPLKFE